MRYAIKFDHAWPVHVNALPTVEGHSHPALRNEKDCSDYVKDVVCE